MVLPTDMKRAGKIRTKIARTPKEACFSRLFVTLDVQIELRVMAV